METEPTQEAGFRIDGVVYPFADMDFSLFDVAFLEQSCGLTVFEWSEHMQASTERGMAPSMSALIGWGAVSMRQAKPGLTVAQFQKAAEVEFTLISPDSAEEDDARPPAMPARSDDSGTSVETSGTPSTESLESSTTEGTAVGVPV